MITEIHLYNKAAMDAAVERLCYRCIRWHRQIGVKLRGGIGVIFNPGCEADLKPKIQSGEDCPYFEQVTKE